MPTACLPTSTYFILNKFEHVWEVPVQWGPTWTNLNMSERGVLQYQLFPIALRSSTCWQQFTISPANSERLADNVSMNFLIYTIPSSYVWNTLETLEWPSQVTDLSAKSKSHPIHEQLIVWHLRVISCLLKSLQTFVDINVNSIPYIILHLYSNVTTSTRKKFFKCTYVHLCLFHLKLFNRK